MRKSLAWLAGFIAAGTTLVVPPPASAAVPNCPVLEFGAAVNGSIQSAGQVDCYAFSGAAGDRVRVRVVETNGSLFAQTRVLRPDGTEVCGRNVYRESTCVLDTTGTHLLTVRDEYGTALGKYSATLQRVNDPVGCSVLRYEQTVSGSLPVWAQTNCWRFAGRAGKTIHLWPRSTYATANPELDVIRPDGSSACNAIGVFACTLDVTGTYTLLGRDNPGTGVGNYDVTLNCDTPPCTFAPAGDFNGDAKTDFAVYRSATDMWYLRYGGATSDAAQWGQAGDSPVPGDYNGDGKAEVAVFAPLTSTWSIRYSATASDTVQWGIPGDIPVPGDYSGDGKADIAVYRPSNGMWYVRNGASVNWGLPGDLPVPADYDGDGKTDFAVYRPSTAVWYVRNSSTGALTAINWGLPGEAPMPADFDGDGRADFAVFRPVTAVWYVRSSTTGAMTAVNWGAADDEPVTGDFDGDGMADIAVYRPSTAVWYVRNSTTGSLTALNWGLPGDIPLGAAVASLTS